MKTLQIMIMPSFNTTRESMGIEEYEDYNSDRVLFQQGYDATVIEVEDNEVFEIEDGYIGRLLSNDEEEIEDDEVQDDEDQDDEDEEFKNDDGDNVYLINDIEDLDDKYEFILEGDLEEGEYQFLSKHNAILCI